MKPSYSEKCAVTNGYGTLLRVLCVFCDCKTRFSSQDEQEDTLKFQVSLPEILESNFSFKLFSGIYFTFWNLKKTKKRL